ncbi:MAG: DNA repair protein RecO [Candidatus Aminicenantia bacterium]
MPIEEGEGFVLRSIEVKDIDKIVTVFTKEHGIIRGIAKGAAKFNNRFGSSLEPITYIKFIYYHKEGRDLFVMKSAEILKSYFEIQRDIEIFAGLSQMAELLEEFVPQRLKEELIFRLFRACVDAVSEGININLCLLYFKTWLLKALGLLPNLKKCKICKKEGEGYLSPSMDGIYCKDCAKLKTVVVIERTERFLEFISKNPPQNLKEFEVSDFERERLENLINELVFHHIEKIPKTLSVKK